MKRVALAVAVLLAAWTVTPAAAFVVEVTTSVAVADTQDETQLSNAVRSAVDGVLSEAIAFRPTLIVLTHAAVVGDRLYIRLLVADKDGEQTFRDLAPEPTTELQI